MGRVGLEVLRMTIYMAFPVGAFHIFNQPAYFEEWVTNIKREIYPPEKEEHKIAIDNVKKQILVQEREELMMIIKENEKNYAASN